MCVSWNVGRSHNIRTRCACRASSRSDEAAASTSVSMSSSSRCMRVCVSVSGQIGGKECTSMPPAIDPTPASPPKKLTASTVPTKMDPRTHPPCAASSRRGWPRPAASGGPRPAPGPPEARLALFFFFFFFCGCFFGEGRTRVVYEYARGTGSTGRVCVVRARRRYIDDGPFVRPT